MTQAVASPSALPAYPTYRVAATAEATKAQFYWLCALILSFCYELPIWYMTNMDRANPRLFDVVAGFGLMILMFQNHNFKRPANNPILKWWARLVLWFAVCAAIWAAFWFPWGPAGKFSVYFGLKYLEGLLCIYLVAVIPLSSRQKHILHWMVVIGGIVVGAYAIIERLRGDSVRYVAEGKELKRVEGTLFSCLGPAYFHVATFAVTAGAMTFAMANKYEASFKKFFLYCTALLAVWPAAFSGSRTGLGMLFIVVTCIILFMKRTRVTVAIAVAFAVLAVLQLMSSDEFMERASKASASVKRLVGFERTSRGYNSISARVNYGLRGLSGFAAEEYRWQGARLPFFGGGFYAVPHSSGRQIKLYRVGYGIHNCYLFPYEQAGILGLLLAAIFFVVSIKCLWKALSYPNETDKQFAIGVWCVTMAFIPAGWVGQVFWRGFGTENFNTMLIILAVLAIRQTTPSRPLHQMRPGQHPGIQPRPYY